MRAVDGGACALSYAGEARHRGRWSRGFDDAIAGLIETLALTRSRTFVFLHAGCVAIGGRALLMPARSFAGKSTLVQELVRAGARYYSDDLAPIDARLRAHPFPRLLRVRAGRGLRRMRVPLSAGRGDRARPAPIAAVWLCSFERSGASPSFKRLAGGAALRRVFAHAPAVRTRPRLVVSTLARLAREVPVFAGGRGEARAAARAFLNLATELRRKPQV